MAPKMRGMPTTKTKQPPSIFDNPSQSTAGSFRHGDQIAIVGLKSQPTLNGRCAFVGAFDEAAERFECHISPLQLAVGPTGGMKMNWVDLAADGAALAIKIKPACMQGINLPSGGPFEAEFQELEPAQKVAVQRAQKALYDESSMYKDGKRRPPNVVGLFRGASTSIVREPQAGVVPDSVGRDFIVVRRQLDSTQHGVAGNVYVVASSPVIVMAYRCLAEADGGALQGKAAGDDYMQRFKSL